MGSLSSLPLTPCKRVWGYTAPAVQLSERFWPQVTKAAHGCWLWSGRISSQGYGVVRIAMKGKRHELPAHRLAYYLANDALPAEWTDFAVGHKCHPQHATCLGGSSCVHRRCVRPDHLTLSTRRVNTRNAELPSILSNKGHMLGQPDRRRSLCTVELCHLPEFSAGKCSKHYFRWYRLVTGRTNYSSADRAS